MASGQVEDSGRLSRLTEAEYDLIKTSYEQTSTEKSNSSEEDYMTDEILVQSETGCSDIVNAIMEIYAEI